MGTGASGNGRTGTRRTWSGRERRSMNRSHCWTPPWSSGSSHTCREHGIKPTEALPLSLHRSTDNGRCVAVGSVAHEAAASAVACRLHVCALHGRCALGVMALSSTRRCNRFPQKAHMRRNLASGSCAWTVAGGPVVKQYHSIVKSCTAV